MRKVEAKPAAVDLTGTSLEDAVQLGIEHCRIGSWDLGLTYLEHGAKLAGAKGALPSMFYSYLGLGIAQRDGRLSEGLRLCEHAIKLEFYQPEAYANLARVQLLANERRSAVDTVRRGLAVDPEYSGLLILQQQLGKRRRPPIPFLSRKNLLNQLLGKIVSLLDR
jgi:tetratricopeptide (TPR) repeat protein